MIEELLPSTRTEAVAWARWMTAWEEYRGSYPDQVIGLARVVSARAMRAFSLTLSEDGRVRDWLPGGKPWQAPRPH